MKYLKKYKQLLERKGIPSDFIILNSIGHVLDPDSGEMYAIFNGGKEYDSENPYEFDAEAAESLYDEELIELEKHITDGDDIFNKRVDSDLIDSVDDILIGIIDMIREFRNPSYGTWVECGTVNIWYHNIRSGREDIGFNRLFPVHKRAAETGNVIYTFKLYDLTAFSYRLSDGRIASLNKFICTTNNEKCEEVVDIMLDTLVRLVLYLNSTGYEFEINGIGNSPKGSIKIPSGDVESRIDGSIIPYEEALRKLFKNNLEFGSFNSEISVKVTHP